MPLFTFSDVSRGDKEHLPAHVDPHRVGVAIAVKVARNGRVEATTCTIRIIPSPIFMVENQLQSTRASILGRTRNSWIRSWLQLVIFEDGECQSKRTVQSWLSP